MFIRVSLEACFLAITFVLSDHNWKRDSACGIPLQLDNTFTVLYMAARDLYLDHHAVDGHRDIALENLDASI